AEFGGARRLAGDSWQAGRRPCGVSAVEHLYVGVAEVPQQPPRTRRGRRVSRVVHDDWPVIRYAQRSHRGLKVLCAGQRMTASCAAWPVRSGELVIEVDEARARDVTGGVEVAPRRTGQ